MVCVKNNSITSCIEFLLYILEAQKTKLSFKLESPRSDYHLSIAYIACSTKQYWKTNMLHYWQGLSELQRFKLFRLSWHFYTIEYFLPKWKYDICYLNRYELKLCKLFTCKVKKLLLVLFYQIISVS